MDSARPFTCELCGFEFDAAGLKCHTGCPMGSRCSLICCPNCGYQEVDQTRSKSARVLRRLWPKGDLERPQRAAEDAVPLSHLAKGSTGEVRSLTGMPAARLTRLSAFGLVPGTEVRVKQRRPVPVIGLGETEVAISEEILAQIWVVPL